METLRLTYLLDTAVWINGVALPQVIPPRIRRLLQTAEPKGLATVSLLETAILYRLGRLELDATLEQFFDVGLAADLRLLELTPAIAARTNQLSRSFQGDPFDRTIVATASILNLTLITTDSAIRDAKECAVEYYAYKPLRPHKGPAFRK